MIKTTFHGMNPITLVFLRYWQIQLYLELGIFRHFANINVEASNFLAFNFFPTMIESLAAMNNSWNLLIQECYHDFSDHAGQHRKGDIHQTWSVCHPPCSCLMPSCHPLNVHDGKKCSHAMFWSTYKTSADWLKCKSSQVTFENKQTNKQSPNNNFSSSYLYIHTQTCYWNDPHIGRHRHHINQNIHNKSLRTRDPSELVSLRWIAFSLWFSVSLAEARWKPIIFMKLWNVCLLLSLQGDGWHHEFVKQVETILNGSTKVSSLPLTSGLM